LVVDEEINMLKVWLDRDIPVSIANAYSWDIYISQDNVTWTLWHSLLAAPFGPFENYFQLRFPTVKTRFVKVVTSPLSPAAAAVVPTFTNAGIILIDNLQAFVVKRVADPNHTEHGITHLLNFDSKVKLLESPSLFYELSLFYARAEPSGTDRYDLLNSLLLDHRINPIFSISGQVAREESGDPNGHRGAYLYSATLRAVPLRTLNHSLVYSGRNEWDGPRQIEGNSLFLYNSAELYYGVHAGVSGGVSISSRETGEESTSYILQSNISMIPHRTMTLTTNYSYEETSVRNAGTERFPTSIHRAEVGLAYRPFPALYLYAQVGVLDQDQADTDILKNFIATWAPFPGGTLLLSVTYNENERSLIDEQTRLVSPSLTWKITSTTVLQLTYVNLKTDSLLQDSNTDVISANLRTSF
jgi:hypothetical protein